MDPITDFQARNVSLQQPAIWYKDALIYQIHVRSFYDSNDDGVGDFRGLTQKLDYIQELGVTAIWLLPFFPSPLRDDGYDIGDYTNVNSAYGTLRDFKSFVQQAHRRELRVITELVLNHTSEQHEWFQRSRRAKPGTKWRDFYVWSDTPDRYRETRIIFEDFETSNWTWDAVAGAYFWHRFYSHQPDLNFDNPEVHEAMLKVVDFWFRLGVDGVRLDAVPYLYEREGTHCENLPETHAFLKKLRSHVDQHYENRMLLAEANQWPEDAAAYFGDGDECHMNFHFPLMPRLFMALKREDRFPILDILEQTPTLPEGCQWGIFLRNHDELTLEMVTDEERDYMYSAYAADPQSRVNVGIRRRLAPLMNNDRRKIELLNGLLLSLPGTPIIYYGDEIGMGDNIYLGDRDGVRTPMQWSTDRNAGFSRTNPQRLFLPTIIDSEYHYETRNVEVQQNSPHSLLWWMRRIIDLRKQFKSFGRGSIEFLTPENAKILAFLREYDGETLLVMVNLSRFVQCVELDLSRFRGKTPIELFGQTRFPAIGELPYFLTLGPYNFYWFQLTWDGQEEPSQQLPACRITGRWETLFQGRSRARAEAALAKYLPGRRWFAGKARSIQRTRVNDFIPISTPPAPSAVGLLFVEVHYVEGDPEFYSLPVLFAQGKQADDILADHQGSGILSVEQGEQTAILCEATWENEFWLPLYDLIARRRSSSSSIKGLAGEVGGYQTKGFRRLGGNGAGDLSVHGGEQSNTSAVLDRRFILKLFRRVNPGENPDLEIGRFLTERTKLDCVPAVAGALEYRPSRGEPITLAVLHEYVRNECDAWTYTLDELGRYFERIISGSSHTIPAAELLPSRSLLDFAKENAPAAVEDIVGSYLEAARLLGQRTAELHTALASVDDDEAFAPEPFSKLYQRSVYQSMRAQVKKSFALLRKQVRRLPDPLSSAASGLLDREDEVLGRFQVLLEKKMETLRMRCHGDYHLGQVLYTGKDFVIIDFEGEPDRPLGERRIKTSPLRDVAGMIRSFHYASHAALLGQVPGVVLQAEGFDTLENWIQIWYTWCSAEFLKSYLSKASESHFLPREKQDLEALLEAFLLEKALYELNYELNNRPDWVRIPLEGILQLLNG